jgi:hypothetical protein
VAGWEQGRKARTWGHAVTVLPPGDDPGKYRWPVSGIDVVVLVAGDIDKETLELLGIELVCAGSLLVVVCDKRERLGGSIFTFKPRTTGA